jgi:hypothetical protein
MPLMTQRPCTTKLLITPFFILILTALLSACNGSDNGGDVQTTNSVPIADAGIDQVLLVGSTVTLSGEQSSDPDEDALTYLWSMTAVPDGSAVSLSDVSAINPTFIADTVGIYTLQLIVDDGIASSDPDIVEVSITEETIASTAGVLCDYDYNEFNDSSSVQLVSSAQWNCDNGIATMVAETSLQMGYPTTKLALFQTLGIQTRLRRSAFLKNTL